MITGTLAQVNAALLLVTYTPNTEYEGPDTLHFSSTSIEDIGTSSATASTTVGITVNGTADTPVLHTAAIITTEDVAVTNISGLSVSIADGSVSDTNNTDTFVARLFVDHGKLAVGTGSGAAITGGIGDNAVDEVVITGTLAQVNAALLLVTYTPQHRIRGPRHAAFLLDLDRGHRHQQRHRLNHRRHHRQRHCRHPGAAHGCHHHHRGRRRHEYQRPQCVDRRWQR